MDFGDFWIFGFLDFWIFGFWILGFGFLGLGFLDVWIFCVRHLSFQSVETASKLDSEKNGVCISIYSVFKGCSCCRGGDHICVYIYGVPCWGTYPVYTCVIDGKKDTLGVWRRLNSIWPSPPD